VSHGRAGEMIAQLELEVETLLQKAEDADSTPLQVRTRVLNDEWEDVFRLWYPDFRQQQSMKAAA
jgi:hypothetical protein